MSREDNGGESDCIYKECRNGVIWETNQGPRDCPYCSQR